MRKATVLALIRHIITFAGGFLIAKGLAAEELISELAGGVTAIVAVVWEIIQNSKDQQKIEQAELDKNFRT